MDETEITRRPAAPAATAARIRNDLPRVTFAVLIIVGLIAASFWILRPFLPALLWSAMIVVATWPLMLSAQRRLWNKRWLAVTVMTGALLLAFVVPFTLAITTLVDNADEIASWVRSVRTAQLPALPEWVKSLPLVGGKIDATYREIATYGPEELTARVEPYAKMAAAWFVSEVGSFGLMALTFLLTLIVSAILYANGESAVAGLRMFFKRIAGVRGEEVVELSGQAIRGVAFGVVVTALVQSLMGAIGLAVAGIPLVGLLTAIMFILAVAQIGAAPIIFAAAAWLWWQDSTGWAIALAVWAIIVGSMDNILRPILIRRGGHLPLLLVFSGVIGGLVAFGLVGIFVGPLVLAVAYRLLEAWVREASTPPAA